MDLITLTSFIAAFCCVLLGKALSICADPQDTDSQWLYVRIRNHRLTGNVAETWRTSTARLCYLQCNLSLSCASFNYNRRNGLCELNRATLMEHPGNFVEHDAVMYFGMCRDLDDYRNLDSVTIEERCEVTNNSNACPGCTEEESFECTFEDNRDRLGSDIIPPSPVLVCSAPACCRTCRETPGCLAWTYVNLARGKVAVL
ncbi:uncharacterized protein [Ptychodera flava]|uniref:uncharacterized protein n=1 Tax=Ptychodera flava TaxID=63121 RepID=UPI00396A6483